MANLGECALPWQKIRHRLLLPYARDWRVFEPGLPPASEFGR